MGVELPEEVVRRRLGVFRGRLGAWLTLTHIHVAFIPVFFVLIGALLSNQVSLTRLFWGCAGLLLGKQGFYLYDEATGRQWASRIPKDQLLKVGHAFVGAGFIAGLYTAWISTPPFLAFVLAIAGLGFAYNYRSFLGGALHNLWNFSLTWATLPLVGGWFLMTENITPSIVVLGIAAAFFSSLVQRFSWTIKAESADTIAYHSRRGQLAVLFATLFVVVSMLLWRVGL